MIKDYFYLAFNNAKKRKVRSGLTMIGIFIGIAAVVALISLSQGLQNAINEQFVKLGSDKLTIQSAETGFGPPGTDVSNHLTSNDKDSVAKVKGVDTVVGRLIRSVRLEFKDEVKYGYAISLPEDQAEADLAIEANDYQIVQGRMLKTDDNYKAVIGVGFSDDYFARPIELRDKILIEGQEFSVVGILKKSGNPTQDGAVLMTEGALKEIMGLGDEYDIIALKITPGEDLEIVQTRVEKELRQTRNVEEGKEDFTVQSPGDILATLNIILVVVQGILVGIAAISLVVGGIGIMNTMYTAVLERTREIGIMKATGARRRQILFLFVVESGLLGLFGGLIGVALGMGISKTVEIVAFQIYGSYLIQASFNPWVIFGALLFAFSVGSFSGFFPARQAANLKPVEALRK